MDALLYLTAWTWKNQLRWRLQRLRQPKYAISLLVGLLYFGWILRPGIHGSGGGVLALVSRGREPILLGASVLLFVVIAAAWVWPSKGKASLIFSSAEVHFLFPAPFTRQQLIGYKLLRLQIGAFASTAIMTLFFRPGSLAIGWMFFLGASIMVGIVTTHLIGVSLARASIIQHGRAGLARQKLPLLVVFGAVAVLVGAVGSAWPRLSALERWSETITLLQQLGSAGLPAIVLWPFKAIVRLPLAPTPVEFVRALPAALALLALNFIWAVRSDAAFEEASAELAEEASKIRSGAQPIFAVKRRAPPFTLRPSGSPEVALLWKNLIMLSRYAGIRTAFILLPLVIGIVVAISADDGSNRVAETLAFLCLFGAFAAMLLGPSMIRNDLRQELDRFAVLKSWPVRGAALVRGEVLAPTIVLTAVVWTLIVCGASASAPLMKDIGLTPSLSYFAAAIVLVPAVLLTQVLLQNAVVVLFPAWVPVRRSHAAGLDVMGQGMLTFLGVMLGVVAAMLPAGALALAAGVLVYLVFSVVPVVIPAVVFSVVLLAECAAASEALGAVLDRTDISAVDPSE